jgi:hypothetical protein
MNRILIGVVGGFFALAGLLAASTVHAADITVRIAETSSSPAVVTLVGRIQHDDYLRFVDATFRIKNATVYFDSDGGVLPDALLIGDLIRLKGFDTAVADINRCHSSCAISWLAGRYRFLGIALIGFHKPSTRSGGSAESGEIYIRQYIRRLGFGKDTADFILSADPNHLNYIANPSDAKSVRLLLTNGKLDGNDHGIEITRRPLPEYIPLP